ncbi:N-acetylmuramoyl-L-alanine amidase [Streptomyces sp. NPDC058914]|uniref:peptidoglycan recognition protein family protein n=1 Tax=Streptomyces TaxID=1883 RepID=UPI0036AA606B
MRGLLATSIGVTCAAALALPLTPPATAVTARPAPATETATAGVRATSPAAPLPGSTQSLPLTPLAPDRSLGGAHGLPRRDVRPFSLVGVVWNDPDAELHGRVQVRTRATGTGTWSGWQDLETHNADHGADPDTSERASAHVRGATAPLWVGDSDGVEVRVTPAADVRSQGTARGPRTATAAPLPSGLRLELVDPGRPEPKAVAAGHAPAGPLGGRAVTASGPMTVPGTATDPGSVTGPGSLTGPGSVTAPGSVNARDTVAAKASQATAASAANRDVAPLGATEIPALDRSATERELLTLRGTDLTGTQRTKPYIGPRPGIVTRRGWGADENLRESGFRYTTKVKAAFVHHTASGNNYTCSQAPSVIRGIYRYHVRSMGWRDIGYNFLVDKCGNIYEGRAGGVTRPVLGAHTLGFNTNSMGIAVIGTFTSTKPSGSAVTAVARLTAWKLGLFGANPRGKTYLKSGGGNLYAKGKNVRLNVISGHRDGFATECPGRHLYGKLGSARSSAARYQGR